MTSSAAVEPAVLNKLKTAVGSGNWVEDATAIDPLVTDQRGLFKGTTALVLFPHSVGAVAKVVSICHYAATPLVPQGGNTGLVGGSVPFEGGGEI